MGALLRGGYLLGRQVLVGLGIMQIGQNVSDIDTDDSSKKGIGFLGWIIILLLGAFSFMIYKIKK